LAENGPTLGPSGLAEDPPPDTRPGSPAGAETTRDTPKLWPPVLTQASLLPSLVV